MAEIKPEKVVVALSGGVDSSVAAATYVNQGVEVIAVTLRLKTCDTSTEKVKSCCGIDDDLQARAVADLLDIPHYFLDVRDEFRKQVLLPSWNEYNSGRTPNPCARCNFSLKFGKLVEYALEIGADAVITGHHARVDHDGEHPVLLRGVDPVKDQSYFLFTLTPKQLKLSFMPIGNMTKADVREYARKAGLPNAEKVESQDACFGVKGECFAETLRKLFGDEPKIGNFVTTDGDVLGKHKGIHYYTIGQRKGLGIALGQPAYVSKIDMDTCDVTLSTDSEDLMTIELIVSGFNWQLTDYTNKEFACSVQVRYRQAPVKAYLTPIDSGLVKIKFKEPIRAVTPGQAVVVYSENKVIGGGWIIKSEK